MKPRLGFLHMSKSYAAGRSLLMATQRKGQVNAGPGGVKEAEVTEPEGQAATDGCLSGFGRKSLHRKQLPEA